MKKYLEIPFLLAVLEAILVLVAIGLAIVENWEAAFFLLVLAIWFEVGS